MTVIAQQTTGSVRGTLNTPDGEPVIGAVVTITDTRSGTSRVVTSNDNGVFAARELIVGGPYTINVVADSYRETTVTDVFTKTTAASAFDITLENQGVLEEVIVVGSASVAVADLAVGPSSNFSFEQITAMPTISRNVRDIIRLDPRVNVGRAAGGNGFGVSCLGGSVKSNSTTVDGVRAADGFGLNASGNSARASFVIPYDAMRSASVEFSPIDVSYGQFTGCMVNVVTKSGGNEFFGSGFYLYNDENLTGDSINGNTVITEPFEDTDWGFEVGGPIIKDKLFFYTAYEKVDEGGAQNRGCIGCGFANEDFITEADANRVAGILTSTYGRDPGTIVRTLPKNSKRWFVRLDWNINDNHRVEASYTKLEEIAWDEDDYGFVGFTLSDNFELQGTDQKSYSVRLFSNWTDRFSTEVRASKVDVQDIQGPVGGGEAQDDNIPRIQILEDGDEIMLSGPGQFRSANDLQYTLEQYKFAGTYDL
ncbi:MAG: TonB-dependent receptor, partial [Xanthomonadales bacterium]|nr:TonB-dependent receptor [Xanthomonadales bacterium]